MPVPFDPRRPLSHEDVQRLMDSRDSAGFVNMLHPLEVVMPRDMIEALVRASMRDLQTTSPPTDNAEAMREHARQVQQRIDFLAWLPQQPTHLTIALYPADDDGLADLEDLQLDMDDSDQDLPF